MLRDYYDYILIDCLPAINIIAINALVAADEVIIPLHTQIFSVKGLEQLFITIQSVVDNGLNDRIKIAGILYTVVEDRTTSFQRIHEILEKTYGNRLRIFHNYIPKSVKAGEAPSHGISIYGYSESSRVSRAYMEFTEEYLSLSGSGEKEARHGSKSV